MVMHNPYTHPHEEDARHDAILATDAMPITGTGKGRVPVTQATAGEHKGRNDEEQIEDKAISEAERILVREELRDHDFPLPTGEGQRTSGAVAEPTREAAPEAVRSGGKQGQIKGDNVSYTDLPVVMDQDMVEPNLLPDK